MAKILVIDDSITIRAQLKKDLIESGHEVLEAGDGCQGIEQLKKIQDIEIIFCDVNMPNMDGLTMCEKIKEEQIGSFSILMLTTESSVELKARGKQAGVMAWITKPYNKEKVLKAVDKLAA